MKFNEAYLCVNCQELLRIDDYDKESGLSFTHCHKCGSKEVIPLNQWLYRNRGVRVTNTPKIKYGNFSATSPRKIG